MEKLETSIKGLEHLAKNTKCIDKKTLRDCITMLRMLEKADTGFDGYVRTQGTQTGGMEVQWVLEWQGNYPTESVTLTHHAGTNTRIQADSVSKQALQIINTVGLFFRLKEEAAAKAKLEKAERPKEEKEDESNKGGVSEKPKLYGNAPLYFV